MRLFRLPLFPRLPFQSAKLKRKTSPPRYSAFRQLVGASTLAFAFLAWTVPLLAQPDVGSFHWVDFHDTKDAPAIAWVTQNLKAEKWTSIREIGVQWDSALVVTTLRATPQSPPLSDTFTVWSVSLAKKDVQPLLHGASEHILNWTTFGGPYQQAPELALTYNDCYGCDSPSTFFTTLYYNFSAHAWRARWVRGDQAAVLSSGGTVDGVTRTQIYGLLTEPPGRDVLATWTHNDYGSAKPAEDFVFEYSVDPVTALEETEGLSGAHAEAMQLRLCKADPGQADPSLAELAHGQDSELCKDLVAAKLKTKPMRRPTTTPPANNHGQAHPAGTKK